MPVNVGRIVKAVAAFAVAALAFYSCDKDKPVDDATLSVTLKSEEISYVASSQFVAVTAPGAWTLSLEFGELEAWATVIPDTGVGSRSNVVLKVKENTSSLQRSCMLVLEGGGQRAEATLTQLAKGSDPIIIHPTTLKPDPVGSWLELPATNESGRYFFTHDMTVGKYNGRNYSFYLDPNAKIAVWVAYPLNSGLIGSNTGRTDDWGLDPKVPRDYQPVIYSAFRGGYDRGHQLPSADRYGNNNPSTFYGTNMTPQRAELNQHAWEKLEGRVRNWSYKFDTLYVVTGADIVGSREYATDNDGKKITVPVGYFKALLGYKKSQTIADTASKGGYTAIGFYFKHQSYSDSQIMSQSMSIDALEKMTGFDFFVNLPDELETRVEADVNSWWSAN